MINSLSDKKIAIIGSGKMGETLASRMLDTGVVKANQLIATDKNSSRLTYMKSTYGVKTTANNREAAEQVDIILLCLKPQVAASIVAGFEDAVHTNQLVISIMASATSTLIEQYFSGNIPVMRAMPNTPCQVGAGMTALAAGKFASESHYQIAEDIFGAVGRTLRIEEKYFDAVTGLSASGPAFIYVVIEALAEGGVKDGLSRDIATQLASQMTLGAAKMVIETGNHPAILKDHVTTPAGCTIDGLLKLEEGGLRVTLIKAVNEATKRAKALVND
ncbi:MAG: pyrroline-5-carboxylate reductase [Balneolales bacterium]